MVSDNEIDQGSSNIIAVAIDDSLGGHKSSIEEAIEKILLWAHSKIGAEQLVQAKEQFYWKTGKFFPDDIFYVNRISYFIDYFIFERPLETSNQFSGKTPFECYQDLKDDHQIQDFHHSVFSVHKISDVGIILKDMIHKTRYKISARSTERFDGILKNDIFQGFIYQIQDQYWLSRGLIFHPHKAYRSIRKSVKKELKKEDLQVNIVLQKLARQQLRHLRHEHVNPRVFYLEESAS
ncbi:hypothetical protein [Pseudobacteriovorax antillogorgiicola]|uniref:Uncharacterized protein n=1 Tax=Pseudobacteriovorax antillogorgiicola TaxID=1513793 RepID=A0A1Y6B4P1_9BACT|nr:hypothetical protein [Pseudobacteriovorax antillogorgiicola]TCS59342.1 hypothetical protein EDD56_101251 [Pseudobacteriovorax antillogorgiicola]SME89146.1 hypothetical protein SAMN06296036_101235 [Pseudobacteriovorax antillogorgiicola]